MPERESRRLVERRSPPTPLLRVATLNLLHDPPALTWSERAPLVTAGFRALDADVILLPEVAWPNEQASTLAEALSPSAARRLTALVMPLITPHGWQESLALHTHYPVLEHDALRYPGAEQFCQRVRVDIGGHALDVYNTHLDPYTADRRRAQIMAILRWMGGHAGADGIVLGGDLNATPESDELRPLRASLRSAHVTAHGHEPAGTSPIPCRLGTTPVRTVDYLWHSATLAVLDCRVIFSEPDAHDRHLFASDHVRLTADLCLTDDRQLPSSIQNT
jgi:endonuclease/exonuclease/phosphatase family metal-dependent hydrolase